MSGAQAHFKQFQHLLEMEAAAEQQALRQVLARRTSGNPEASGWTLTGLVVRDEDAGLGGRILLTLGKRNQTLPLPWTRLNTGAPVLLTEEGADHDGWRGVISRLAWDTVQVAFPTWPEPTNPKPTFRLDRATDEIARQRMRRALERAQSATSGRPAALRDVLLGLQRPELLPLNTAALQEIPISPALNPSQQAAVRLALRADDLAILHGPPGTGKTTTLAELIRQFVRRGHKVLACAPSNLAVDNLLEALLRAGVNALRLGHPARVLPEVRAHTLELVAAEHPDMRLAQKMRREAAEMRRSAGKWSRARPEPGAKQALRVESKDLLAEARQLEDQLVERLLDSAPVLCATLTGLESDLIGARRFDYCVIDEAGQAVEPAAWIPLQYARRLVLAGDPYQLPPTVISLDAARQGLSISLLERVMSDLCGRYPNLPVVQRLDVQYRMHAHIMGFSSEEFYDGSQIADDSVAGHRLCDLPGVQDTPLTSTPVTFIDTAGASYDEAEETDGTSRWNPQEAALAARQAQALLDAGLAPAQIAVITPYAAQARHLRELLRHPELEIDSVDGFQGREKEAVIVSLVRSNPEGEIGFLNDVRRMNVALTRARRKLIVIGDSATVTCEGFYQRLVTYFDAIGAYHSVWEEL